MNNIVFTTLKAKNVISIGGDIELDYRKGCGLTYVYGVNKDNPGTTNGSGKSAIMISCLLIALFGKTVNNTSNAYLYNRQASASEGGYVELELTKNSVDNYRIFVELKPNKKKTSCSLNYFLFKNGEEITKSSKAETLAYIEDEILECGFEVFKNSIIISSSNIMNFFEMPKKIKNEYLQGIFSLDPIGNAYALANTKFNELKRSIKELTDKLKEILDNQQNISAKSKGWDATHQSSIDEAKRRLENEIVKLNEQKEMVIEQPKNYEKKLEVIQNYSTYLGKKSELEKQIRGIQRSRNESEATIRTNSMIISKNSELIDTVCDHCRPKVSKLFKLDEAKKSIDECNEQLKTFDESESTLSEKLKKISDYIDRVSDARVEINNYNSELKVQKNNVRYLEESVERLTENLESVKKQTNPFLGLFEDYSNKEIDVENQLKRVTNISQYYGLVKEIFSENGVKQVIIGKIVEMLNVSIHSYLKQMGADYLVYFDNKFDYEFITPSGPCEYTSFSAGERRKLDLAILFTFRDVLGCSSLKTNICIIDEILDSAIDTMTLNSIIQILKRKSTEDNQSIFVISHREGLMESEYFTHRICVEKENGFSKIHQES